MKVVRLNDVIEAGKDVHCPKGGFISYRYLLKGDGMGFSVHKTVIPKGKRQIWHYKKHLEACFCVSGKAVLTNLETQQRFLIEPDTLYALDKHDRHSFKAIEDTVLISVFNPPVVSNEVHAADGSYPMGDENE